MDFDGFTRSIVMQFEGFESSITASWLRLRLGGGNGLKQLAFENQQALFRFIKGADALTASYLNAAVGGALTDAVETGRGALFMRSLKRIALDDLNIVLRKAKGQDGLKKLLIRADDAMELLAVRADQRLDLRTTDSAGRSWKSAGLVKFLARDFAYQLHITSLVGELKAQGDLVQVAYTDPAHEHHGLVLSLSGETPGYRSFVSMRDTIFHPNATAFLIHVPTESQVPAAG